MIESLLSWSASAGWAGERGLLALGVVFFIGALTFLPRPPACIIGGLLFGLWAFPVALVGTTVGAVVAFLLSRYLLRSHFARIIARRPRWKLIVTAVDAEGWRLLGLLRLASPFPDRVELSVRPDRHADMALYRGHLFRIRSPDSGVHLSWGRRPNGNRFAIDLGGKAGIHADRMRARDPRGLACHAARQITARPQARRFITLNGGATRIPPLAIAVPQSPFGLQRRRRHIAGFRRLLRSRPIGQAANVTRRGGEARLEDPVEVRNVGKAGGRRDVVDLAPAMARVLQQPMGHVQPLVEHEAREGRSGALEQVLDVARAHAVTGGDSRQAQVAGSEPVQNVGFDGVEAGRRKSAMLGSMGGIAVDPEAQPHQVEDVLRHGVVFSRTELGPEPIGNFHLMEKKPGELPVGRDGPRNLVFEIPAQILQHLLGNASAPAAAPGLAHPRRLAIADQGHLPNAQIARPAALPGLQPPPGSDDKIQPVARFALHVAAANRMHRRTAQRADTQEGVLAACELVDEVVAVERLEIGSKPLAGVFLAPLLVGRSGRLSCIPEVEHFWPASFPADDHSTISASGRGRL